MHEQNRASRHLWEKYVPDTSFKFVVNGYNRSISKARQREVIEDFSYMGFMGRIDLLGPEVTMGCFEECEPRSSTHCCGAVPENETHALIVNVCRTDSGVRGTTRHEHEEAGELREVYFGRLVRKACRGTFFCLSERCYLCPDRARQCASSGQNIRRQKTAIFWQHKHGSRDISSHGQSNLGTATYITPSTITLSPGHVFRTTPHAARHARPRQEN